MEDIQRRSDNLVKTAQVDLERIEAELARVEQEKRPNYRLTVIEYMTYWSGQAKILDRLIEAYELGTRLYLFARQKGMLQDHPTGEFRISRMEFKKKYLPLGTTLDDFKRNHLWEKEPWQNDVDLIREYNKTFKFPEGKVNPELYAFCMFEDAQFRGVNEPSIRELFRARSKVIAPSSSELLRLEKLLIRTAFANSIDAMDDLNVTEAVTVIRGNNRQQYVEEAKRREIELAILRCW